MERRGYTGAMATCFLIFLLPMIVGLVTYGQAVEMAKEKIQSASLSSLFRCMETIDGRLETTDRLVNQLSLLAVFSELQSGKSPYEDRNVIPTLIGFQEALGSYLSPESFVDGTFVLFNRPQVAVSHRYIFLSYRDLYDFSFRSAGIPYEAFLAEIQSSAGPRFHMLPRVNLNGTQEEMLVYIHSYPINTPRFNGSVIAMISKTKLWDIIDGVFSEQESSIYILDRDWQVMAAFDRAPIRSDIEGTLVRDNMPGTEGVFQAQVNGEELYLSYVVSPRTGWRYISALPKKAVMHEVDALRRLTVVLTAAVLLVGSGLIVLFVLRQVRVNRLLSNVLSDRLGVTYGGQRGDIERISRSLADIVSDNQALQKRLHAQLPVLRNTYLDKALHGGFETEEEGRLFGEQIGLNWSGQEKLVLLAEMDQRLLGEGGAEYDVIKILLCDVFQLYFQTVYSYNMDRRSEAFILEFSPQQERPAEEVDQAVQRAVRLILEKYRIPVRFFAGRPFQNLLEARLSFEEALRVMGSRNLYPDALVLWPSMLDKRRSSFYYPLDLEMRLFESIRDGNETLAEQMILQIREENLTRRTLPEPMQRALTDNLYCTLLKVWGSIRACSEEGSRAVEAKFAQIKKCGDTAQRFVLLLEAGKQICTQSAQSLWLSGKTGRAWRTGKIVETVIGYVNQNFDHPNLNLNTVADQFGWSVPYLSKVFKEYAHVSFSQYLERLRIERAGSLLQTGKSIEDVSRLVGYSTVITFRKAFKRVNGVAPSDYRQNHPSLERKE